MEQNEHKKWFGRGIYGSKDVPICLLDRLIAGLIAATVLLTVIFAVNGGYVVSFDTGGVSEVAYQKHRYGSLAGEPEIPVKPGFIFAGWYDTEEESWDFSANKVSGDMVLTAHWVPAEITVKFDLTGGTYCGETEIPPLAVIYQQVYGLLPVPESNGKIFSGWEYSGTRITAESVVNMPGEHVLTALWK